MHALNATDLSRELNTCRVGKRIVVLSEIGSTNTYTLETIAPEGAITDGTVVVAERQTAGRGRLGRSWESPAGASLMFTVLLWERERARRPAFWMMAAGVSVVCGIEAVTDVAPIIRWPNDVYVGEKKLAGILVESRWEENQERKLDPVEQKFGDRVPVVIGIGVNCLQQTGHFSEEIRESATSLDLISSHPVDRTAVCRSILSSLDHYLNANHHVSDEQLTKEWFEHSGDIGARATLVSRGEEFSGRIVDVHPKQGLVLQLDTGARKHFDPATTSRL